MRSLIIAMLVVLSYAVSAQSGVSAQKVHALRLHPGDDIKLKLIEYVKEQKIKAGYIITCVANLSQANIRLSNRNETKIWKESFEVVSLTGTLSPDGNHIHISVADKDGKTIGGHMMDGCIVYTTAEIIIGEAPELSFTREADSVTTYKELKITPVEINRDHVNKTLPK